MNVFLRTYRSYKAHSQYFAYMVKSNLKIKQANSHLGYLWWILEPLMFMMVYVFVLSIIRGQSSPLLRVNVYCGLIAFKLSSTVLNNSTKSIRGSIGVLKNIDVPYFLFPTIKVVTSCVYYFFSLIVLFGLLVFYQVGIGWTVLNYFFVFFVHLTFLFSISTIFAHIGVYFTDIDNMLPVISRLWLYLSPVLYSLEEVPERFRNVYLLNPLASIITSYKNIFLYKKMPMYVELIIIFIASVSLLYIGLYLLQKNKGKYTKVI